ncbi:hypothetical protein [Bradyrhizobium sp. UNPA324]|uniref:hypothetical protein n=1 Tax=Bradyrhizobium sp. UNPA324 TaxID=1141174 RepID=UPI00114F20EB|nr:hypothetical protein [Bradyrhizobium sp. UNPA324]TQF33839.1 hypothetical protein UNPA324_33200 [Bradyrhizobium sp. UNPA324]
MQFGMGRRIVAAVVALSMLSGCAEIDRRGGTVAEIEDYVLFVANTKSHRLFRSYLLAGVLLAAARQGSHNETDKAAIEGNLKTVLTISSEAYNCLYPRGTGKYIVVGFDDATKVQNAPNKIGTIDASGYTEPAICQFFDEKMARLDYALFRLALSSLFNAQSNVYLGEIRDKLMGKIPVLSSTAKAAIYANKAVNETTTIVDDLLNLSFSSAGPVVTLLPLYRDSLEINLWLIIDNLTRRCSTFAWAIDWNAPVDATYDISSEAAVCKTLAYARYIMNNGNGNLRLWRAFVSNMNYATLNFDAYVPHFYLVTAFIWRTCKSFFDAENACKTVMAGTLADDPVYKEIFEQRYFIRGTGGRFYSVKRQTPTEYARQPVPTRPSEPSSAVAAPRREPESTGSIEQSKPAAPSMPTR